MNVAFEVRANVAIRIIVEGVELEPHPLLTMDANGTRRKAWQSIASAALQEFAPSSPRLTPPPPSAGQAKRKYRKRRPAEVPADGRVINAAEAIQSQLDRQERKRAKWRMAAAVKRQRELAAKTANGEAGRRTPAFKPATCVHCGKEFIRGGPRQVLCKRKPCQGWKRKQVAQARREQKTSATSAQENA